MTSEPAELHLSWFLHPRATVTQRPVVVTGVFDLLHVGHIRFLTEVHRRGRPLFIGIEDDARVRAWKGPQRPVNPAGSRAEVLAALKVIDAVFVISGDPSNSTSEHYLPLLAELHPAAIAFTKGDRYADAKRFSASALRAEAWEFPHIDGISTTTLIRRLSESSGGPSTNSPGRAAGC
jgi:D-glycero-beta-D-manno-heptose 1-phosphate adenylyltransferase